MRSHDLGLWLFASALIVTSLSITQLTQLLRQVPDSKDPVIILRAINTAVVFFLSLASILIPRRPDVFFKDSKVDRQWTVSALSRYTWTWVEPLLRHASKKNDLDAADIPQPDLKLRSEDLKKNWDNFNFQGSLLRSLIWAYKGGVALQWGVTIFRCFLGIVPFWIMLRIIRILEKRETEGTPTLELWSLVIWMAFLNFLDAVSSLCPNCLPPELTSLLVDRRMGLLVLLCGYGSAYPSPTVDSGL